VVVKKKKQTYTEAREGPASGKLGSDGYIKILRSSSQASFLSSMPLQKQQQDQ
jgi:hypothetical protein